MAYGLLIVLKTSKTAVKKIPATRPSKKPLPWRLKLPSTFCTWSVRWILTASGAIALLPLSLKSTPTIKAPIPFTSSLEKHEFCLLFALSILRPQKDLVKTTKRINAIDKLIMVLVDLDLKALPCPLRSTQVRLHLQIIVTATGYYSKRPGTWIKLPVTIITKKGILLTSALSPTSQKTSISLGNLHISD